MNTLTLALLAAFTAIDTATPEELTEAVETLRDLTDNNAIDQWVTDPAVDAIEREVEIRTGNLLADGTPIDAYDAVSKAIGDYRNA